MKWQARLIDNEAYFWSGEPAAALLTAHLHPTNFNLYTSTTRNEAMRYLRLIPDLNGNVVLYEKFWTNTDQTLESERPKSVAPPLLVYADLIRSQDARNIEIAKMIHEKYLAPNLPTT